MRGSVGLHFGFDHAGRGGVFAEGASNTETDFLQIELRAAHNQAWILKSSPVSPSFWRESMARSFSAWSVLRQSTYFLTP